MYHLVALTESMGEDAGVLLASRHAGERTRFPLLPAAYEDPARAAELVQEVLDFCEGVAAMDDRGALVGFLTAFESKPDPHSPMARYTPEHASVHLVHGHAVAADASSTRVYAPMFAELAARALDRGVTDHVVHVPIGAGDTEAAWAALGFGRSAAVAIRDLTPLRNRPATDVEIRTASPDELDVVDRLVDEESVFHAGSPIFRPYRRAETADAVRAELATELASDDHAFLLARRGHDDVGILSVGPGLGSPLYVPDAAAYIGSTAVLASDRGTGAGTALVDAALAWANDHGYRAACLHFATSNLTASAFWTGVGFIPVMVHLRRRLDERILHSRPPV